MLFLIYVSNSQAIRHNQSPGVHSIEADISTYTNEEREELASITREILPRERQDVKFPEGIVLADTYHQSYGPAHLLEIMPPNGGGLLSYLQAQITKRAEEAAKKQHAIAKSVAECAQVLRERRTTTSHHSICTADKKIEYQTLSPAWPHMYDNSHAKHILDSQEAQAWVAKLQARNEAAREAADAEKSQCDAKARAAEAAAQSEMSAWAQAHGSQRLKNCLAEKIECAAIYRDERLAADRPGWQWYDDVDGKLDEDVRNPPEEAFTLLADARKTAPSAKLVFVPAWTPKSTEEDEDPEEQPSGYAAEAEFLGKTIVYGWPR